jgi:hypothetical protein
MSNFPTIPEFTNSLEELSTAVRALKQSVELLAGLRQGEALGAPQMFVQNEEPNRGKQGLYKKGDIWINTTTNRLYFWTGSVWQISI